MFPIIIKNQTTFFLFVMFLSLKFYEGKSSNLGFLNCVWSFFCQSPKNFICRDDACVHTLCVEPSHVRVWMCFHNEHNCHRLSFFLFYSNPSERTYQIFFIYIFLCCKEMLDQILINPITFLPVPSSYWASERGPCFNLNFKYYISTLGGLIKKNWQFWWVGVTGRKC